MNHLVIGMGEVGGAVYQVLSDRYDVSTLDIHAEPIKRQIDVLHICFPYSKDFIKEVEKYQEQYQSKLVIIYSSVPIGTTRRINHAVHSPIEGKHPRLERSVRVFTRYIGYNDKKDCNLAFKIWDPTVGCELLPNSDWTEFLKLASTSKYGINIVWADYMADVAERLEMPYDYVKDWDKAYNKLYNHLKFPQYKKYVLDPPDDGYIGGHCIVPNAKLLNDDYPDEMLEAIVEMGEDYDN